MKNEFWVIGSDYECVDCQEVVPGTTQVFGPFYSYTEANQVWRERSLAHRFSATTRFSIVSAAVNPVKMAA